MYLSLESRYGGQRILASSQEGWRELLTRTESGQRLRVYSRGQSYFDDHVAYPF